MLDAAVWGAPAGIVVWMVWGFGVAEYNLRWGEQPAETPARRPISA
jgi:hypothetical protein